MWGCQVLTTHQMTRHLNADDSGGVFTIVWHGVAHALVCPWCWARMAWYWVYCGVSPRVPSFLSPLPPPLLSQLPFFSSSTLTGILNRSFDQVLVSHEATMGCQCWAPWVVVVVEWGSTDVSIPPTHPLGCGARIMGCRTWFDTCGGCLPGCLVVAGTCLGATADGGGGCLPACCLYLPLL
jgi:hypothetical protein